MVIKSCASKLAPVLNKLFQLSYSDGIFPSSWKLAHVSLSPKRGHSDPLNYRPIAITSPISKIMETIIIKQLLALLLETNNLLSDNQYGFRQARSIGDFLAHAFYAWSSALESYGESRVTSLNTSKAFDRVTQRSPC